MKNYGKAMEYYNDIIEKRAPGQDYALFQRGMIQGLQGAYKSDNNIMRDKDDPVVPPMPVGPSQGGSALNLFDLDKMRRQQMAPQQVQPPTANPVPTQTPMQVPAPVTTSPTPYQAPVPAPAFVPAAPPPAVNTVPGTQSPGAQP